MELTGAKFRSQKIPSEFEVVQFLGEYRRFLTKPLLL